MCQLCIFDDKEVILLCTKKKASTLDTTVITAKSVFWGGMVPCPLGCQDSIICIKLHAKVRNGPPPPFVTWTESLSTQTDRIWVKTAFGRRPNFAQENLKAMNHPANSGGLQ